MHTIEHRDARMAAHQGAPEPQPAEPRTKSRPAPQDDAGRDGVPTAAQVNI
jgi:hypothetical protein